jgi:hypothetical protein
MKTNRFDRVTDLINARLDGVKKVVTEDFKGTNPYRMVKEPDSEAIAKYLTMPPEIKQSFQQTAPQAFQTWENKVQMAMGRYVNGK